MTKESSFQKRVKSRISDMLPESIIFKTDPSQLQGVPDLLILNGSKWGALEVKKSKNAMHRPNQDYRVNQFNKMSYAAFIYPENEKEVLDELYKALSGAEGKACSV